MQILGLIVGLGFLTLLGSQIFSSYTSQAELQRKFRDLEERTAEALADQKKLESDMEYFSIPANLEKELRARFNYRGQDEKMIIIVPQETARPSSTP